MTILFLNYDAKGYPDRNIFAPPLKFAIFANMTDDNRTITYVSGTTSGNYSDYLSNYFNHTLGITFHTWRNRNSHNR